MTVRPMVPADVVTMVTMGRAMHAESVYRSMSFDEAKLYALADRILAQPDVLFGCVAEKAGKIVGMMAGSLGVQYFSVEPVASDLFVYVVPEERGSSVAPRMILAYEHWAVSRGARHITLGISTGIAMERTEGLYARLGYGPWGRTFRKEI